MAFSNILPDPVNKITDAGVYDNSTGTAGPGFASAALRSVGETQVSRTRSGRGVQRAQSLHYWECDIKYNPMTRDEFAPVDSFLLSRNARKTPFFIALPQYASSRDSTWASTVSTHPVYVETAASAGDTVLTIKHLSLSGSPKPTDMITITDPTDTNHTKMYKITRVESNTVYETAGLASTQRRIHIHPPLARDVAIGLPAITATSNTTTTFTSSGHGLVAGQKLRAISGLPPELTADAIYYVAATGLTVNAFRVSATSGGSTITLTAGSGAIFRPTPTVPVFTNPMIRCILKTDVHEYDLQTNNLFQFGLSVEEIQP